VSTLFVVIATAVVTYLIVVIGEQFITREKAIQHRIEHIYSVADSQFTRVMGQLLPPPILPGNRVTPLQNGVEIFPAMLNAIASARQSINLETYVYWSGNMGDVFTDALAERARAGVEVNVLLDWVGSIPLSADLISRMQSAGVNFERYHKPQWWALRRLNQRTHRKLLIVDGRIGFTGGAGIADEWTGNAESPRHWRDTHFQVEGPAVGQLQSAFTDNWLKTSAKILHDERYFPELKPAGDTYCQVFKSSADEGAESLRLMYLLSIAAATRRILIGNAYLVPDELAIEALCAARRRGVLVEIIVPGEHIDNRLVRLASQRTWGRLLDADIAIYEYLPTMYHTKLMIVDERWLVVGSTNFDNRSFRLNDEVSLNVLDSRLVDDQARHFEADKAKSRRVTRQSWRRRPLIQRMRERATDIIRSQL
jgi:cardiolipin synthase